MKDLFNRIIRVKFSNIIDKDLLDQVKDKCREHNLKLSDAIEFGLKKFIEYIKNSEEKKGSPKMTKKED